MKMYNVRALESLSLFCHVCGLISILIGITVIAMDVMNKDFNKIQTGIFIFITGYSFTKISAKLSVIILDEKRYDY